MTEWLADTLIATSLLMLLVLLVRRPVARLFGAHVSYLLWVIPAARMFVPVITETVVRPSPDPIATPLMPAGQTDVTALAQGASAVPVPATTIPVDLSTVDAAPWYEAALASAGGWTAAVLIVWAVGALTFFCARIGQYFRQRSSILCDARQTGEVGNIRIVRSAHVRGPLAFGILDKVIAVPFDFDATFTPRERELALDHELQHHRAGDLIASLAGFVVLSIHWFNPIAWMAWKAFRFDQEAACDARVIDSMGGIDRDTYGRAIAKAASGDAILFAAALDRPKTLKLRLQTMTFHRHKFLRIGGTAAIAVGLIIGLPMTATKAVAFVDAPTAVAPAVGLASPQAQLAATTSNETAGAAAQSTQAAQPTAPANAATSRKRDEMKIVIDGENKRWSQLSAEEKAEIRKEMVKAREEIREAQQDLRNSRRDVREAQREARQDVRIDRERMRDELAHARAEIDREIARIERDHSGHSHATAALAGLREGRESLTAIDVDRTVATAMANIDWKQIDRDMAEAQLDLEKTLRELDRCCEED